MIAYSCSYVFSSKSAICAKTRYEAVSELVSWEFYLNLSSAYDDTVFYASPVYKVSEMGAGPASSHINIKHAVESIFMV